MGGCDVYYRQATVGEVARSLGVDVSNDRRCQHCSAPMGMRDRVCLSCQRAVDPVPPGAGPPAGAAHLLPAQASRAQAPYGQALPPARPVPAPRLPPGEACPPPPAGPVPPIQIELAWGRDRRRVTVPAAGATIGSVDQADVVVAAAFLAPLHARIAPCDGAWTVESLAPAGQVLLRGRAVRRATITHGDMFRLADRLGNFVTVTMTSGTGRARRDGALRGVDIRVHGARVDAPRAGHGRALLDHVSLRLAPASLTVVAGPGGAGPAALLRLLSGQLAAADGSVSYNGVDLAGGRQACAPLMGYVPREDTVHAGLTVGEALAYQARLRLGPGPAQAARDARVEHVLALLGLWDQRDRLVGTLGREQRKRVCLACELLSEPQVLFLDEPASGLDPGPDKRMMLLLRLLADQGRTVVLTARATAHVDMCDTLVLVGPGGHVVYAGPPAAAPGWFGVPTLGDVFSLVESPDAARRAAWRVLFTQQADGSGPGPAPARLPPPGPRPRRDAALGAARRLADQARIFAGRRVRLAGRDRTALGFSLLPGVAVLLTALATLRPFGSATAGSAPAFAFGCAAVWAGTIGAVRELAGEKAIWRREFLAGGSLPAYLSSKVAVLGALAAFQALTLTVFADLCLRLPSRNGLITGFAALWLAAASGMALGLLVSAASPSAGRAVSLVPYLLVTQLVLGGAGVRLGLAPGWPMLLVLCACGLAATAGLLRRQGRRWSAGG